MGGLIASDVPTRSPDVESIDIDGDVLLYDGVQLRLLAGTAAIIWRAVDGASDAGAIAASLEQQSAGASGAAAEVLDFLEQLCQIGAVDVPVRPPEPAYTRPDHVGFTGDSTAIILVDLRDGSRHALRDTGARVWQLLVERQRTSVVIDHLRAEYGGETAGLAVDVEALVRTLVEVGLLLGHDASALHLPDAAV